MKTLIAKLKQNPQLYYSFSIAASWAGAGSLMNSTTMAKTLGVIPALIWCIFNTIACMVISDECIRWSVKRNEKKGRGADRRRVLNYIML